MRFYLFLLLIPIYSSAQNTITPNSAFQGEQLEVFISGTSEDFYNDYSSCITSTRLISTDDYSTVIDMYSSYCDWICFGIYEYINTSEKPIGSYDLQTNGCQTNNSWQTLATDVFTILPQPQITTLFPNEVLVNSGSIDISIVGENTSFFNHNFNENSIQLFSQNSNEIYYSTDFYVISNNLIIATFLQYKILGPTLYNYLQLKNLA